MPPCLLSLNGGAALLLFFFLSDPAVSSYFFVSEKFENEIIFMIYYPGQKKNQNRVISRNQGA